MRFCFVNMPIEYYSPVSGGAIATIIAQTGRELIRAGHGVTVLTPMDGNAVYDIGTVIPVIVKGRNDLSFAARRLSGLRQRFGRWDWPYFEHYLASVKKQLRRLQPAPDVVVLFNDLYSSPQVRKVLPNARIAVWLQNECRTHAANAAATAQATDVFLTCSQYIQDWTAREHGIPAEKFAVVPSGVDLEAFTPRADYESPRAVPRIFFIGRIDPNKGPDIAVDAVAALQSEGVALQMTVAGGRWFYGNDDPMADPYFRMLHGKMQAIGAEYLGHVPRVNVPALVRDHDIVCVLSRSNEPFGLVVLEAMASGCAVISSNRGGLPEACGGAALLVDPDDAAAVAGALKSLVKDPDRLACAKRQSIARAKRASWSVVADQLAPLAAKTAA